MQTFQQESLEAYIFYFDVLGVGDMYCNDRTVMDRLRMFQRAVREAPLPLGRPWSTLITLYDNVWARINAAEHIADNIVLTLAIHTMRSAFNSGFSRYFGACTKGIHTFDLLEKTLVHGSEPCDIRIQHIDTLSEPHICAATLEKWLAKLSKTGNSLFETPCVWISEKVADHRFLVDHEKMPGFDYSVIGMCDFSDYPVDNKPWPFPQNSKFTAIGI